jgi:hypothetical protein
LLKEKSDGVYYNDEKIGELVEEKEDVTLWYHKTFVVSNA